MREVTNEDVAKYASKKCKSCHGDGWLRIWVYTDPDHRERMRIICKCAERRFKKGMGDRLYVRSDGVTMLLKDEEVAA